MNTPTDTPLAQLNVAHDNYYADDDEIDISELFAVLSGGKWWIAGFTGLAILLGAFYSWVTPRQFPADAMLQVEKMQGGMSAMFGELGPLFGEETPVAAEIELIRSRMVVGRVVDDLNLFLSAEPQYFPVVGRAIARGWNASGEQPFRSPLLGMEQFAWGGENIRLGSLEVPPRLIGEPLTLVARGDERYDLLAGRNGTLLGEGGVVGEPFEIETPAGALSIFVRELDARPGTRFTVVRHDRDRVVSNLRNSLQVSERGRQSGVLSVQLEAESPDAAQQRVNRIVQVYQRQNVERRSEEAEQTLEFLNTQLPELREQLDAAESQLNAFRLERGSADLTKETEIVLQQSVELEQRRLELQQRRQEAERRYTPDHPVVQSIDAQMRNIANELGQVSSRVRDLPETQQQLLRLNRDVQVNTELYTSLLNSAQELQVARAGTVGNVRIVDLAVRPQGPSKPRTALILALSLVLGGMLGVMFVFLRRALRRGILEPGQVEREVGLATYASVPFSKAERKLDRQRKRGIRRGSGLLALDQPQDVCTEALRSLRTALHFATMDAPNHIVMFTGPSPGLGKSFVSLNFGAVLAEAGQRVLVMDCDLRRGHMHAVLGQARAPGITDCLSGQADLSDALHEVPERPGLYLLPTGTIAPNPTELLLSESFKQLLDTLAQRFDYIVMDTPPVLAVTDAAIIGRMAGTTLMLLKEGEHPPPVLRDALQRLRQAGVSVRGVVFNMVGRTPGRYGSGQYAYRYGYTYTYKSAKT